MAIKKTELYSSLWQSCDELRGGMDASQYKDYVLVLLFVKYVSDKYAGQPGALIEVPSGGGFADMVALKGDKEIGDKINKIIGRLAEANDLKGVIDVADFNNPDKLGRGKEMVDRLSNLVGIFQNPGLDFSSNRAEGDDILGDAYEYLMRHFATESGKSKGQFYTPAEVSRIMAKVIGIGAAQSQTETLYDPTCGSGSLLLKAADEAPTNVSIYGQEMDNATAALAKMNMILHDNPTAEIWQDNSLSRPHWTTGNSLKTFDYVVANPPFSNKSWSNGVDPDNDQYGRFEYGIPPKKNGDYAFLLHILRSLKSTGKGAVILPHGVLFRGNVEGKIRKNIIRRGYIKGIIGLPPNLFYGTGIPACIIVLDKENAPGRTGIFMIDASKGFMKDGNKNRLRHQDIRKIVDVFTAVETPVETPVETQNLASLPSRQPRYARMVSHAEIEAQDYNLNIPRYIDSTEPEDLQDIAAHLLGGIPNRDIDDLGRYWDVFPSLRGELFEDGPRPGYSQLMVAADKIKPTIHAHPEFVAYTQQGNAIFDKWKARNMSRLRGIAVDSRATPLIGALSEDLLQTFAVETQDSASLPSLIDKYDVYQHLMSYWANTMQDDVHMISVDGWRANSDLIPAQLVINRYYATEQQAIQSLEAHKAAITRQKEEMDEEHGGEDGLLEEVKNDKGKISKTVLKARLKAIRDDPEDADELAVLNRYLALMDQESQASRQIKGAQKALGAKVAAQYEGLSVDEVKTLVVDDKWLTTLAAEVQTELDCISQTLSGRIKDLAERYSTPMPQLATEVAALGARVDVHLKMMGFVWN